MGRLKFLPAGVISGSGTRPRPVVIWLNTGASSCRIKISLSKYSTCVYKVSNLKHSYLAKLAAVKLVIASVSGNVPGKAYSSKRTCGIVLKIRLLAADK